MDVKTRYKIATYTSIDERDNEDLYFLEYKLY
jgi:hypothetical protein